MPIEDIHELIEVLEKAGELKRISTQVDSELELAEILRRTMYDEGPALLFQNIKGYEYVSSGQCIWFDEKIRTITRKHQTSLKLDKGLQICQRWKFQKEC